MEANGWKDVSVSLWSGMVHWPDNPAVRIEMPLDAAMGRARVIGIHDPESIKPGDLREHEIRSGERIQLKTQNSARSWPSRAFIDDFVYVSREAARYLTASNIRAVGIDFKAEQSDGRLLGLS